MPSVFISYRRDDTSGEAGHLAADLRARFGHSNVFIDVDSIDPGRDFDEKITIALAKCRVTLVLIGRHWLTAAGPDGTRRLAEESDYVRKEIALALKRSDVAVIPVLVEGAPMPPHEELPAEIADLTKYQGFELSNKRWKFDVRQLLRAVLRYDGWWWRIVRGQPAWVKLGVPVALIAAVAVILSTSSSGTSAKGPALFPQTSPPVVAECQHKLLFAVDGTAGPLTCGKGTINTIAWQYYEHFNPTVMQLGRFATEGQVINAVCADARASTATDPQETLAYQLAYIYNGWQFVLALDPATMKCK